MKIVVLGGCGAQGSVICADLVKDSEVSEIVCADRRLEKAKRLAEWLKSDKVSPMRVDVSKPKELLRATKGVDVVVNSVVPKYNLNIMDAALKSGANYQDMASGPCPGFFDDFEETVFRQLRLSGKWKEIGLTALINTGCDPGVTNVFAREAADRLDHVGEIRIKDAAFMEAKETISTWSPETYLGDLIAKTIVYEGGKYKKLPPFSGEEVYTFPDPVGPQIVVHHEHEEVITLGHFIGKGLRYVEFKMGFTREDLIVDKAIVDLGFVSDEAVTVKGVRVVPKDVFVALTPPTLSMEEVSKKVKDGVLIDERGYITVNVNGEKAGVKTAYSFIMPYISIKEANKRIPGATSTSYMTGVPAAIFTSILGRGDIKTKGVIPPECLEEKVRASFLAKLPGKGITYREVVEKFIA